MRVLIVTQHFPPEIGAPQARLSALADAWAGAGDTVTVLTAMPNYPTGVVPPAYRGTLRRTERQDGYRVVRTWVYATPNEGVARRTAAHLSFMVSSVLLGARRSGPADTVVVSSPAFLSIGAGWALARLKRATFVIEVRDLWPGLFPQLGVLTNRRLLAALERLELAAYAAADLVVVVTDGFRANLVSRGVPAGKVRVIRNGVTPGQFDPGTKPDPAVRERLGAGPADCLVLYAGTHGLCQGLPFIADSALALAAEPVRFAFVGTGAQKELLRQRVTERSLGNVTLSPPVPKAEMPGLLASADICLVILRDVPMFATVVPSKMFEYLAAGRAVIGAVTGEAAQILRAAGAVVVPPEDSAALAAAVRALAADPQRRRAMGERGRAYAAQHCDRAVLARKYREILREPKLSGGGRASRPPSGGDGGALPPAATGALREPARPLGAAP